MTNQYLLLAVLIMGMVTLALRAAPFVLLRKAAGSPLMTYLGAVMPPGVMVLLVAYNVGAVPFTDASKALPVLGGVLATVLVHHWRRNALLSIVIGTAVHILLRHALR